MHVVVVVTGLTSSVQDVQGLALGTIAKMVQLAQPQQLASHLPDLTAAMLESLSGMEVRSTPIPRQHRITKEPSHNTSKCNFHSNDM